MHVLPAYWKASQFRTGTGDAEFFNLNRKSSESGLIIHFDPVYYSFKDATQTTDIIQDCTH